MNNRPHSAGGRETGFPMLCAVFIRLSMQADFLFRAPCAGKSHKEKT